MSGRGQSRGRGGGFPRGERGGSSSRGDRGGGSWRSGQAGPSSRGGRGESPSRSDRGGSSFRGSRGDSWSRGGRGDTPSRGDRGGEFFRGGRGRGGQAQVPEAYGADTAIPPPDSEVKTTEDNVQSSLLAPPAGELIDLSPLKLSARLAQRPGYGTKGAPATVWANHFRMTSINSAKLYRYHIRINPEPKGRKKTRVIQMLLDEGHISRLSPGLASDYKMLLFAKEELTEDDIAEQITYRAEDEDEPRASAKVYTVKLQHNGTLDLAALMSYVRSRDGRATLQELGDCLQALNIILGHHAKSQPDITTMSIGSNRHYMIDTESEDRQTAEVFDLTGALHAYRGYFTSVRNGASRITLNIQVKNTAVYAPFPLRMTIDGFQDLHGPSLARLERFLKRLRITPNHLPVRKNKKGNIIHKIKTIAGLASSRDGSEQENPPRVRRHGAGPDEVTFFLQDAQSASGPSQGSSGGPSSGQYLTVSSYFRQKYGVQLDPQYPVVNISSRKNPIYFPADVCFVVPGQPAQDKLNSEQTRRMINFAVRRPHLNAASIVDQGTAVVGTDPQNPTLARFGISFSNRLISVPARLLTGPNVLYADNRVATTRFGSWNMNEMNFTSRTELAGFWTFVVVTDGRPADLNNVNSEFHVLMRSFKDEIERNGAKLGTPRGRHPGFNVDLSRGESVESFFEYASEQEMRFLLFILQSNDTRTYNTIKYLGDIEYGIHTVCCLQSNLTRKRGANFDLQYFANIALKINLKLGGANQRLDQSKLGIIGEGKTMVVGIDVTHPSPGSSQSASSVSGMVASIDRRCSQFPAILKIQEAREEIVSELKDMLKSRLRLWQQHNQDAFPENILVYRDGISEGQFDRVIEQEIPPMKEACEEIYPATATKRGLPRLTVIICGKRHNTRFYPSTTQAGKIDVRSGNNPNGTVVDRGVTDPRCWDFYLQAHTAIQGTARPAHYYVLHDEIFNTRKLSQIDHNEGNQNAHDVLESLTHNLSYLYGRATKAVSICPPAYYADLLCERARCYLSDYFEPDSEGDASSAAPSGTGEVGPSGDRVQIHEQLKDSMFYI